MQRVVTLFVFIATFLPLCSVSIAQKSEKPNDAAEKNPAAGEDAQVQKRKSSAQESPLPAEMTARLGALIEKDWKDRPEWAEMAVSILKDNQMGMGGRGGWFGRGVSRYRWTWLQKRFDNDPADGKIKRSEMKNMIFDGDFERLDRNGNGVISEKDLDWSGGNPVLVEWSPVNEIFFQLDEDSNGRLTMQELKAFFDKAAGDFEFITPEDLHNALKLSKPPTGNQNRQLSPEVRWKMLKRLLNGELGDLEPGPDLNQPAPDFNLPLITHNDDKTELVSTDRFVKLSDSRGKRPVVLIFGSFT